MKRLLTIIALISMLMSQQPSVTMQLNSSILNAKLNRLSINDFDFIGAGKTQNLFTGIININTESNNTLRFKLYFLFSYNGKRVVNAQTKVVTGVATQQFTFSNTQIGDAISIQRVASDGSPTSAGSLQFDNLNISDDAGLISSSRLSAKLPDGKYFMQVRAELLDGTTVVAEATDQREFNLRQTWPINLQNPVNEVNTSTPLFQWDSRASTYPKVTLYVWENDGNKTSSINKSPILKKVYDNPDNTIIPTSFAFPSDNPRPLEDGKKYYWTTKVTIVTAAGPKELNNEILEFKYKKPSDDNINETAVNQILQQLLGDAFSVVEKEFAGFSLKSMTLNGDAAQINNLATYIQKVTSGEYNLLVETY